MTPDIAIKYSYYDRTFDSSNLYSVDYRNGVFYTSKTQKDTSGSGVKNITYKTSKHTISYDLANEIDRYRYNPSSNSVSVRTEALSVKNNLVKVVWTTVADKADLKALRRYFSPIIQTFGIRFQ